MCLFFLLQVLDLAYIRYICTLLDTVGWSPEYSICRATYAYLVQVEDRINVVGAVQWA
jgi:hypothetical protein